MLSRKGATRRACIALLCCAGPCFVAAHARSVVHAAPSTVRPLVLTAARLRGGAEAPAARRTVAQPKQVSGLRALAEKHEKLLAMLFGTGIMLGSLCLKLPQIVKLVRNRSVLGLSLAAAYSEIPMYSSFAIYHARLGYPWDTYGENVIITAQNLAIIAIFWVLQPPGLAHAVLALSVGVALHAALWLLPVKYQPLIAQAQPVSMLCGYLPQIMLNARNGCTGQLSAATTVLRFVGCLIRLGTTIVRIGDDVWLVLAYVLSALLTAVLCGQLLFLPAACAAGAA